MFWGNTKCTTCFPPEPIKIKWPKREEIAPRIGNGLEALAFAIVIFILLLIGYQSINLVGLLNEDSPTFVSDGAQLFSAIATIVLTIITVVTLVVNNETTRENTKLTKAMAEAQTEPLISVEVKPKPLERESLLYLNVTNVGRGVARRVAFIDVPAFHIPAGKNIQDMAFIKQGIKYMPPGQNYNMPIKDLLAPDKDESEYLLKFTVTYENTTGKTLTEPVEIDFRAFRCPL